MAAGSNFGHHTSVSNVHINASTYGVAKEFIAIFYDRSSGFVTACLNSKYLHLIAIIKQR